MRNLSALVMAGLMALGGLLAGGRAAAQETRFRAGVDLVGLSVVVVDPQGHPISGLSRDDFTVFEDGFPQEITFFADMPLPIDLAVLLDTSASMLDKLDTVQQAALEFTEVVRPTDRISIVEIKDAVKVLHPLDEDVAAARRAIASTTARGNTALYNGLYLTLRELARQVRTDDDVRRQAIVVLSDGDDTTSLVGFDDVMELVKESGVAIYTITLRGTTISPLFSRDRAQQAESQFAMKALAQETGGRSFFPASALELSGIYGAIAAELSSQYAVGYVPAKPQMDGSYRRISIRVDHDGARARTRAGYVAEPSPVAAR